MGRRAFDFHHRRIKIINTSHYHHLTACASCSHIQSENHRQALMAKFAPPPSASARRQFSRHLDRRRTRAIAMYLADVLRGKTGKRQGLLRLARKAFRHESAPVQEMYCRKASEVEQQNKAGKLLALEDGDAGVGASGGIFGPIEASGGIQASHGAASSHNSPLFNEMLRKLMEPSDIPAGTLHDVDPTRDLPVPDGWRPEDWEVDPVWWPPRTSPAPTRCRPGTRCSAGGVARAVTAGPPRTPLREQHFEIRGSDSGIQAK